MAYTIAELRKLSDEDLIREHDSVATSTVMGLNYYSNELARRAQAHETRTIVDYTRQLTILTWVIAIATVVNLALAAILVIRT
jgi:hypothetical protein